MLKIIRGLLYGLATLAGVAGLFVGGVPLVEYLVEMLRDSEYRYYYDTHYLFEPQIIFLLSAILLVGIRIALALDKGIRPAPPREAAGSGKPPAASAPASESSPAAPVAEMPAPPVDTADAKLSRLLNQKKN
jgi:MFS family permease